MIRIGTCRNPSTLLHNQGGAVIPVMQGAALTVRPANVWGWWAQSGAGKSTLMRMVYGNYLAAGGSILVGGLDVTRAAPRQIIALRRDTLGYVSQFLRVVPRVPTIEVVAEPCCNWGVAPEAPRGPRPAGAAEHPRAAVGAVAHHLFGRRTAAREHRARLCPCLSRACCWTSRRPALTPPTARSC
jgi:predicted ABC-type transport system involved in lysophospholipase L1 biosynthesis ATPase subunit